jgi:hypothetical protein
MQMHSQSMSPVAGNQVQEKHWFQFEEPMNDPMNEPSCEPTREPTKRKDLDAEFPRNQSLSTSNQDREGVRNNAALSNPSKQQVSFVDQPGIENEINNPIAASDSTHNLWHMPPPINLDSSGLNCSSRTEVMKQCGKVYSNTTTLMNQEAHLRSASPQSFKSALVLFSTICSFGYGVSCMAHSLQKKSTVASTAKVSFSNGADAKTNNALSFRHTASSTLQLVVAFVDNKLSKAQPNQTMPHPSDTRLLPHVSWLLHPLTTSSQKAQPNQTMPYLSVANQTNPSMANLHPARSSWLSRKFGWLVLRESKLHQTSKFIVA